MPKCNSTLPSGWFSWVKATGAYADLMRLTRSARIYAPLPPREDAGIKMLRRFIFTTAIIRLSFRSETPPHHTVSRFVRYQAEAQRTVLAPANYTCFHWTVFQLEDCPPLDLASHPYRLGRVGRCCR